MKLLNFKAGNEIRPGIKVHGGIIDVIEAGAIHSIDVPETMDEIISGGEGSLSKLSKLIEKDNRIIPEEKIVYAPCVTNPEKILCIGLNYASHAAETNENLPSNPVIFSKFNNALAAHRQEITLPESAEKFDYEAELVIVMGKEAFNVSKEDALSYVFGYTAGNDISARDLQFRTGQWLLGKTCDGFAPVGPYIVTADEIDPDNLDIKCEINGVLRQTSNTKNMIFSCASLVSYISKHMTLKPGDIIFTGTPEGVILGMPENKQVWLKSGDEMKVTIENIGELVNVLK